MFTKVLLDPQSFYLQCLEKDQLSQRQRRQQCFVKLAYIPIRSSVTLSSLQRDHWYMYTSISQKLEAMSEPVSYLKSATPHPLLLRLEQLLLCFPQIFCKPVLFSGSYLSSYPNGKEEQHLGELIIDCLGWDLNPGPQIHN